MSRAALRTTVPQAVSEASHFREWVAYAPALPFALVGRLRNRHFLAIDVVAFVVTPTLALALRTDGASLAGSLPSLFAVTLAFVLVKLACLGLFGIYNVLWRYASVDELARIGVAGVAALCFQTALFVVVLRPAGLVDPGFPRSVPLIDGLLTLLAVGGLRYSVRLAERFSQATGDRRGAGRVLVVGVEPTGVAIVKDMLANPRRGLHPVGFVDESPALQGAKVCGVSVLGRQRDLPELISDTGASLVVIALSGASGKPIRELVSICERAGARAKIVPSMSDLLDGKVTVSQLRDVQIEDLLRRKQIRTDTSDVRKLIRGKRVLVTGGGGSIGSELCRQVLRYEPAELVMLGHGENSIFEIHNELLRQLAARHPHGGHNGSTQPGDTDLSSNGTSTAAIPRLAPIIADIRSRDRLEQVFREYRPEIVFHAAAHKHVHLMEIHPVEAVDNNVFGTRNLLECALAFNVGRFVMLSTDKAVNPKCVMGATKRVAEGLVHRAAQSSGKPYVVVRFGNVLGSRGSVVRTFKQQIASGGPVTITHPDMRRYFMTIPEAVELVLQAAALGQGEEVFTLDMGEQVRITDLARDMIELSGLELGRDIDIVYVGPRPGEKLSEELFVDSDTFKRTADERIFVASNANASAPPAFREMLATLELAVRRGRTSETLGMLHSLVPEFVADEPTTGELSVLGTESVPVTDVAPRAVAA